MLGVGGEEEAARDADSDFERLGESAIGRRWRGGLVRGHSGRHRASRGLLRDILDCCEDR